MDWYFHNIAILPCFLWSAIKTAWTCMGMLDLGVNGFCSWGGKWAPFLFSSHVCTKAVIMLYYNCQLCFVSAASHHSPSLIKFGGKYRQGRGVWAEELTTFKRPCGWIIAAMKRPWLRPDVAPSRRWGGEEEEPTQRVKSCELLHMTCIQTATHTLGLLRIFISFY